MIDPTTAYAIAERMALAYFKNPLLVANLCDEQIDRSGALIGYVRDAARAQRKDAGLITKEGHHG